VNGQPQSKYLKKIKMARDYFNPVKAVLMQHKITINKNADIKSLSISVKFDLVTQWMRYESLRGCGAIHTSAGREGRFMDTPVLPAFENLIERFNDWANIQALSQLKNERSYVNAKRLIFIHTLIEFGEKLAFIYFRKMQRQAIKKDKKSGI
jgi:hypothetical protein